MSKNTSKSRSKNNTISHGIQSIRQWGSAYQEGIQSQLNAVSLLNGVTYAPGADIPTAVDLVRQSGYLGVLHMVGGKLILTYKPHPGANISRTEILVRPNGTFSARNLKTFRPTLNALIAMLIPAARPLPRRLPNKPGQNTQYSALPQRRLSIGPTSYDKVPPINPSRRRPPVLSPSNYDRVPTVGYGIIPDDLFKGAVGYGVLPDDN